MRNLKVGSRPGSTMRLLGVLDLPIEIHTAHDPQWRTYEEFRAGVAGGRRRLVLINLFGTDKRGTCVPGRKLPETPFCRRLNLDRVW